MITLDTLKSELADAILAYFEHAERLEKQGYTRAYSSLQIIELNSIINDSTKIVRLHKAMLEYIEDKLPRPFGERVRYALGIERDYDLHNNLVKILVQAKYLPDKLDRIDERAEWREEKAQWDKQVDERIKNVREELLANPEILVSEKITRLSESNIKLQKLVVQLQKALEAAQRERDYWHTQYTLTRTQLNNIAAEKTQYKDQLQVALGEINRLMKHNSQSPANNKQQQKSNPSNFTPRKQ